MRLNTSLLFTLFVAANLMAGTQGLTARQHILEELLNPSHYDSAISPNFGKGLPTTVSVQLSIFNMYSVSATAMEYSIDCVLRQWWIDERLNYTRYNTTLDKLEVDEKSVDRVWKPDLYFVNEKRGSFHSITNRNRAIFIYRNGTVIYSIRIALALQCTMLLQFFPFDTQTCSLKLQSFGYTGNVVDVDWVSRHDAVEIRELEMPQFTLSKEVILSDFFEEYMTGRFASIKADLQLERKIGYYILQVIIPSILLVVLSWISFWIDPQAVPARVSLSVTCILTMTTQSSGVRQTLPPVSYVKAIDVWMLVCLVFVFAALLEFAYVNVLTRKLKRDCSSKSSGSKTTPKTKDTNFDNGKDNNEKAHLMETSFSDRKNESMEIITNKTRPCSNIDKDGVKQSQVCTMCLPTLKRIDSLLEDEDASIRVDKISRILFPFAFSMFTIVFLCTCTVK